MGSPRLQCGHDWKDHGVDDVNHAVCADDVGLGHISTVNHDLVTVDLYRYLRALDRLGRREFHDISRHDFPWHNVAGEDCNQLCLVLRLQQVRHSAFRQLGKCLVCRGENRERPVAFQGLY